MHVLSDILTSELGGGCDESTLALDMRGGPNVAPLVLFRELLPRLSLTSFLTNILYRISRGRG